MRLRLGIQIGDGQIRALATKRLRTAPGDGLIVGDADHKRALACKGKHGTPRILHDVAVQHSGESCRKRENPGGLCEGRCCTLFPRAQIDPGSPLARRPGYREAGRFGPAVYEHFKEYADYGDHHRNPPLIFKGGNLCGFIGR